MKKLEKMNYQPKKSQIGKNNSREERNTISYQQDSQFKNIKFSQLLEKKGVNLQASMSVSELKRKIAKDVIKNERDPQKFIENL